MSRKAYTPAVTALVLGLGAIACQDVPTAPVRPDRPADLLNLGRSDSRGITGGGKKDSPYVCFMSARATSGVTAYEYGRIGVRFPQSAVAADGSTRVYRFVLLEPGTQLGDTPLGAVNCRIPDTPEAVEIMNRRLNVEREKAAKVDKYGVSEIRSCPDGGCWLDGLIAIGYPSPRTPYYGGGGYTGTAVCQYFCDSGGGGWNASYADGAYSGGGSDWDPGTPSEPEPCDTGDPFLDSQTVQQGMDQLWQSSNPTANLAQRVERFGWIVRTSTGFRIDAVGTGNFCEWDGSAKWPPEGPDSISGFIHTHPYNIGDLVPVCERAPGDTVSKIVQWREYDGTPSTVDRQTSVSLGMSLPRSGDPLPGIILDANGIRVFKGFDTTISGNIDRCGY